MKRKLIIGERIMYVDALTPVNVVFTAKISGTIDPDILRAALLKIQKKHPLLRMSIDDQQKGGPYFLLNENIREIPVRMVGRESDEDWLTEARSELDQLFDGKDEPLARIVWLKSAGVSELLWVLPHCICDGSTLVALMQEMLLLLDEPDTELVPYATFNSVKELLPSSFSASSAKIFKARMFSLLGNVFFYFKPSRRKVAAGNNYFLHWRLNQEETAKLIELSKAEKTTVHATLCIAFMNAFQQVMGARAHGKVICPVDIRRFIPEIKNDTMFAFAPIVELDTDMKADIDFWTRARTLKTELTTKVEALKVEELLWMSEYFHAVANKMIRFLKATDGTHDVTLSNMGKLRIPETYKSFVVDHICSPTVAFPWRNPNTLVTSTFKDQMDFTLQSNDTFMTEEEAALIKTKAMNLIFDDLKQLSVA
ncbi:phthiocerol/phthiodiolone dimycocerosyl transferase family protein [Pedobacter cryoconitis]|uniref:Phthiocerol/phthiodiolone dimycocerosyl transferase n=1 Tax=Pedobacter cryoconitis TaxID=188932 RepID=A0A7X0IZ14_9SPHI|nr:condensation domain-containing protein [Pedobacter cryoconitis]MBB6498066.1 NRPS condensation-like uncharacterized protein [Pedobacter cryoconitis]